MTLGFSTQINGKPNYFIQKIWIGLISNLGDQLDNLLYQEKHRNKFGFYWRPEIELPPKLHTMREDPHDRWKAGTDIHMVINNRTKNRFQFTPVVKCVSTQKVDIIYSGGKINTVDIYIDGECYVANYEKEYNMSSQRQERMEALAINDGFESPEDFLSYFNSSCIRKLIHWTDLKY